ncbi:MAG TPA: bifunctional oligoribonuclease/PAP phosphatase NrnA [Acidobacteriaceae bacterium]|nr:bifunctional oligoribonuclease/PAP phosphatase NrnA [Acidobacteriaceae bacterium]
MTDHATRRTSAGTSGTIHTQGRKVPIEGLAAVLDAIRQREHFLLTSHCRPDGDAVGSLLALWMILKEMGKHADMQLCDRVPLIYRTLPCAEQIRHASTLAEGFKPDAVILLECDSVERSRLQGVRDEFLINIDHHTSGNLFAPVNWIDTEASAVAEMVYRLAIAANVRVTSPMATCLYTALLSDTGSFCYEGTCAGTFTLARELVELGASPSRIAEDLYFSNPLSKMRLLGSALTTLQREGRIAWLWVAQDDMARLAASEEDCLGIVNYAIGISGVEVAAFLREMPDGRVRVSLRSKSKIRVTQVAEQFGGGGHENASGCTLDGPLNSAMERVLGELRRHLDQHVIPGVA